MSHHTSREYHEEVEKDWISVVSGAKTETFDRYTPWELTQKWAKVQVISGDESIQYLFHENDHFRKMCRKQNKMKARQKVDPH